MRIIPAIFLSLAAFTTSARADTCSGYQSAAVQKIREEVQRLDLLTEAMGALGFKPPESLKGYYDYLGLLKSSFERGLDVAENADAAQAQYRKLMSNREARCTLAAAKQWGWQAAKTDPQVRDDIDICLAAAVSRYQADAVALTLDWKNPNSVIGGLVRQWTGQCSGKDRAPASNANEASLEVVRVGPLMRALAICRESAAGEWTSAMLKHCDCMATKIGDNEILAQDWIITQKSDWGYDPSDLRLPDEITTLLVATCALR